MTTGALPENGAGIPILSKMTATKDAPIDALGEPGRKNSNNKETNTQNRATLLINVLLLVVVVVVMVVVGFTLLLWFISGLLMEFASDSSEFGSLYRLWDAVIGSV